MDGLRGANYFLKKADPSSAFCEPTNYDNSDLAKTFLEVATAKPELKELRGALAAQAALRVAFPCGNRGLPKPSFKRILCKKPHKAAQFRY